MKERWGRSEEKERNKEVNTNRVAAEHGLNGYFSHSFPTYWPLELYSYPI